jgi:hypothetical protein
VGIIRKEGKHVKGNPPFPERAEIIGGNESRSQKAYRIIFQDGMNAAYTPLVLIFQKPP